MLTKFLIQLTNLDQVVHYGDQSSLRILIADSNRINSIRNLSGSFFLRHFNRFSLRHNQIHPNEVTNQKQKYQCPFF